MRNSPGPLSRLGAALAAWALMPAALAQTPDEPLVQSEEAGAVVTRLLVPAPEEAVRRLLDDPATFGRLAPDVLAQDIRAHGACQELHTDTRGLLVPLHVATLRCPISGGWRETLLEGASFTRYDAEVKLAPIEGGTQVTYRVAVGLDLPVPARLVSGNVKRSARLTMQALRELFIRKPPPAPAPEEAP
jgi:hypothetical protein